MELLVVPHRPSDGDGSARQDGEAHSTARLIFCFLALYPLDVGHVKGIAAGIVSHALLKLLSGRPREGHPVLYVLAVLLCLRYAFV